MNFYKGVREPASTPQEKKDHVKTFILNACRNISARWPNYQCEIYREDKEGNETGVHVTGSSSGYSRYDTEVYLRHDPGVDTPPWVPGVLSAVAQYFGIGNDPEVVQGILEMALKIASGLFESTKREIAESFGGIALTHIAINHKSNIIAGQYPANPDDPNSRPFWALPLSGEEVEVSDPDWTVISIQG